VMAPTRRRDASGLWWHCEEDEWYAASLAHWSASEGADVLGGCEGVAEADLSGSLDFLRSVAGWAVQGEPVQGSCAMDVGAGCGRVTEGVLLHAFEHVHMVEVSAALIDQARKQLCEHTPRLEITQASLQSFAPIDVQTYDTIWMQWILGHLTDASLVRLLRVCLRALKPSGFIIVKENNAPPSHCREGKGNYLLDKVCDKSKILALLFDWLVMITF